MKVKFDICTSSSKPLKLNFKLIYEPENEPFLPALELQQNWTVRLPLAPYVEEPQSIDHGHWRGPFPVHVAETPSTLGGCVGSNGFP